MGNKEFMDKAQNKEVKKSFSIHSIEIKCFLVYHQQARRTDEEYY